MATALLIAVVAGGLIALEIVSPSHAVDAGVRAPVETVILAVTLLIARLLAEVAASTRQLRDVLLLLGVLALSAAGFAYWAGPALAGGRASASGDPVRLAFELTGAVALAAAALVPATVPAPRVRGGARVVTALGIGAITLATVLANALTADSTSATASGARAGALPTSADLLSAAILVIAGLAFVTRSWRLERGSGLLAAASLLFAAAGVEFVSAPVVPADWLTPGDGARLAAFTLLLGGVYLRYAGLLRTQAHTAIRSERERVARDLHDGLAQDLACITAQAQRLDCRLDPQHPLVLASRDALAELRRMIADLTASSAATSEEAVQLVARDAGRRLNVDVGVWGVADDGSEIDRGHDLRTRDILIRSTREAIMRASADGGSRQVDVAVSRRAGRLVVQVSDSAEGTTEAPAGEAAHGGRARAVSRLSAEWSRRSRRARAV